MTQKSLIIYTTTLLQLIATPLKSQNDTIKVELKSIDVSVAKPVFLNSKIKTFAINRDEIHHLPVNGLDQLLESNTGFDIRNRSIGGTQADISIRGGSFDQVLVLLNGINITDPQTGHYNLDIPVELSDIKRIELLHGTSARIYGPNAFSGVINIITGNPTGKINTEISAGNYNTFNQNISTGFNISNLKYFLSFGHKKSAGYIPNTDYEIYNSFIQSMLSSKKAGDFNLQLAFQQKSYGANSFYSFAYPNQFDYTKTIFGALNWDYKFKKTTFNAQIYHRLHYDRFELFRDSITNKPAWYKSHNYHLTNVSGLKSMVNTSLPAGVDLTSGIDIRNENILSNALGHLLNSEKTNLFDNEHNFTKSDNRIISGIFADLSKKIRTGEISLGGSGKYSAKYGILWSGGFEVNIQPAKHTFLYFTANTAYRLPTFTDLYLQNSIQKADENLVPEQSTTFETGFKFNKSGFNLKGDAFYRIGKNIIDWVKFSGSSVWESKNLASINTFGSDLTIEYQFFESFFQKISLSYSFLNSDKQAVEFDSKYALDYLKHKANLQLNHKITKNISANWLISYNDRSGSYSDFKTNLLTAYQPYLMTDLKLIWKLKKLEIFGNFYNLLNVKYADYGGLSLPGANFITGAKLTL